jgi:signal transduction histidine kinase
MNLLANAVKYTPPGGRVTEKPLLAKHRSILEVEDIGCGIAMEEMWELSRRFHRTDRARSAEECGAVLGLPIAQGIVDAYGGAIWAESDNSKGTRFIVSLPAAPT